MNALNLNHSLFLHVLLGQHTSPHSVWTSLPVFVKDLFKLINLCSQDFSENLTFNLYLTLPLVNALMAEVSNTQTHWTDFKKVNFCVLPTD